MKTLVQGLLARRKIVLIFSLAILLPALILGYMSLNAYSKRREAVRRFLESNLWISGESALRAVEAALLDREASILSTIDYAALTKLNNPAPCDDARDPGGAAGAPEASCIPFLLDQDFLIPAVPSGSLPQTLRPVRCCGSWRWPPRQHPSVRSATWSSGWAWITPSMPSDSVAVRRFGKASCHRGTRRQREASPISSQWTGISS
jgi:hypothetical protein